MSIDRKTLPSLGDLTRVFGHIGLINFGGPAGQIALMHRTLVEDLAWVDEDEFLRALNFCTLLPGPEAQQLATYLGWKLHGLRGGLIAGLLFIGPGALVVLALSAVYAYAGHVGLITAAFLGVKGAVLAIVFEALLRVGRRTLKDWPRRGIALSALIAIAVFQVPFPLLIALAGIAGAVLSHLGMVSWSPNAEPHAPHVPTKPLVLRSAWTVASWGLIWATPLVLVGVLLGPRHVLFEIGLFFSKLSLVTFGGAYAVLTYMAQEAVNTFGWLGPREMVDGLGLAETTPGPLILVTEFVGFLAAFRSPDPFVPMVAGLLGALIALWMTFAPCFLWIFAGAPFVERLSAARRLQAALAAITAAVVGVIANLTIWFSIHVLFTRFRPFPAPWGEIALPDLSSFSLGAAGLAALGMLILFRLKAGVPATLAGCTVAAVLASLFFRQGGV